MTLTLPMVILGAIALLSLGLLLGTTWTIQAFRPNLRRQAEERRRLNQQWTAVRDARRRVVRCPRCASPLSEQDGWYVASALVEDQPDDD